MWRLIMGYLLRMSAEIHDWLADLRDTDPAAAVGAGEALAALMNEGANLAAPLVAGVADPRRPADPDEAFRLSYQVKLEQLQVARRRAMSVTSLVGDSRKQLAELEQILARLAVQRRTAPAADRPEQAAQTAQTVQTVQAAEQLAAAERDAAELRRMLPQMTEAEH